MSLVASLPGRPLTDAEVASLNRADAVELAVAVDPGDLGDPDDPEESDPDADGGDGSAPPAGGDGVEGLLLATDSWVKGLDFLGGAWEVVETVAIEAEADRYEALRACEDAVRANRVE